MTDVSDAHGRLIYRPSAWQALYHSLVVDEALGAGSAGPGKTTCLIADPLQQMRVEHARCTGDPRSVTRDESSWLFQAILKYRLGWGDSEGWALHLRRTTPTLAQTIGKASRLYKAVDPGVKFDTQLHTFTFSSGYKIQYGHCKDANSHEDYLSNAYTHIAFDELVTFNQDQYEGVSSRARSDDPILIRMVKIRSMSNPMVRRESGENYVVRDPHWVRRYFVEPHRDGKMVLTRKIIMDDGSTKEATRIYLPAKLSDNPNKAFAADYEFRLKQRLPHIRQAMLRGDWWVTAGCYFSEVWNPRLHTCRPFKIPKDWPQFRSMDWGFKSEGCVHWHAVDPEGRMWTHRELTFKGKDAPQVAKLIKEIEIGLDLWNEQRNHSRINGPADTQLWEERGDRGKTKAEEMAHAGVTWVPADKRSRGRNGQRVAERLMDHDEGTKTPGLVIFSSCPRLIENLPLVQTEQNDIETPAKGATDHWYESESYACAHASRPVPTVKREEDEDESEPAPRRKWGRWGYGGSSSID